MRNRTFTILTTLILFASLLASGQSLLRASAASRRATSVQDQLSKLPANLREQGAAILKESDEKKRSGLAKKLAESHPADAMEFLISVLDQDASATVRMAIVDALGKHRHARVLQVLTWRLGRQENDEMAALAFKRLVKDQRFIGTGPLSLGVIKPENESVRVLAFGDFGVGTADQKRVADQMLKQHQMRKFDFGITLGDNFYGKGLNTPTHKRWETQWEQPYTRLGIKFYAALGNHDAEYDALSPAAEILRTNRSESWRMPASYYTYTAGPVQFFVLDTNRNVGHVGTKLNAAQLAWLEKELTDSRALWKVVYGHHPVKSDNQHNDDPYTKQLRNTLLLPALKKSGPVDVYIAGHDHDMEYLKPESGINMYLSGGGGKDLRDLKSTPTNRIWGKKIHGFTVLEADQDKLIVTFISVDGSELCKSTLRKGKAPENACPE